MFVVSIEAAKADYPDYEFISALTPSVQKAAFHAKDAQGNDVCLKIISPEYEINRLSREIRALQLITHPNVVRLMQYTYSSTPGSQRHYMIEEFVHGEDLSERLLPGEPWRPEDACEFFSALFDGLSELNRAMVVHRDLKPSNIRVRADGVPVIIDFGLARHLQLPAITDTSDGAGIGTPMYFAPEQFRGTKHDIDHRTDLFAAGILLYRALTGHHPFWREGMSRGELCSAVCDSDDHLRLAEYCALLRPWKLIVGRLLEKQRARRPYNAGQVAATLRKIGGRDAAGSLAPVR